MSTLSITLSPALGRFIRQEKEAENYSSTQEVVSTVLEKEMQRKKEMAWLKKQIAVGIRQADRGQLVEFDAEKIKAEGRRRMLLKKKGRK